MPCAVAYGDAATAAVQAARRAAAILQGVVGSCAKGVNPQDSIAGQVRTGATGGDAATKSAPRRGILAGDAAGDDALRDVAAGKIQMSERAAEFAGRVEAWDWLAVHVDDALF